MYVTRICKACGTQFEVTRQRGRMPLYCSAEECKRRRGATAYRDWYARRRTEGMPARQSNVVPCTGCGKPLAGGRGSLPEGLRRCRACRRHGPGEHLETR